MGTATGTDRVVHASDGTAIAVREIGSDNAPISVVFSHGFCLRMNAWAPQRRDLVRRLGENAKLVFYDHRGHGRSGAAQPATYTLPGLAADLNSVILETTSTRQRTVLVGHSMGGMTILAFAARYPETLRRVGGVALISTAAGGLDTCGIGRALRTPAIPLLHAAAHVAPAPTGQAWRITRRLLAPLLGIPVADYPVALANQQCARMITETSIVTIAALLAAFRCHDETAGLAAIADLPALVACGEGDRITPMCHSLRMAQALPRAEMLRVAGAGHMLGLEHPTLISAAISRLVSTAAPRLAMVGT